MYRFPSIVSDRHTSKVASTYIVNDMSINIYCIWLGSNLHLLVLTSACHRRIQPLTHRKTDECLSRTTNRNQLFQFPSVHPLNPRYDPVLKWARMSVKKV